MQDKAGHQTVAQLSGHKPAMLASSVQSVIACNVTAPRVCTLVLFIFDAFGVPYTQGPGHVLRTPLRPGISLLYVTSLPVGPPLDIVAT